MLLANKSFAVDTKFLKSKFYRAFNGIYRRVCKLKNELVTVQMINFFCKPYLLYATERLGLTVTQTCSLRNSWQCAVSHVFNTTCEFVNFICSVINDMLLDLCIRNISVVNKTTTLKTETETKTEVPKHKRNVNIIESQIKAVMYHE